MAPSPGSPPPPSKSLRPDPTQASGLYNTAGASPGRHGSAGAVIVPAASPARPLQVVAGSPFSPQPRHLCDGEGLWVEGMYLCVVTEPMPPFAIVAASRGWLQFCGFGAKEVKGRTLSMLQGPATERIVAAKLVNAAHKGIPTDAVLVSAHKANTKRCLHRALPHPHPRTLTRTLTLTLTLPLPLTRSTTRSTASPSTTTCASTPSPRTACSRDSRSSRSPLLQPLAHAALPLTTPHYPTLPLTTPHHDPSLTH